MTESSRAVFLSYASEDASAAKNISDALKTAGMEVWFDQTELRGGDAWDASIRRQIKACALFMPIISANAHARTEGYFRFEWKLAVDRSHLMSPDQAFLVPVVIDDTPHLDERLPERFRELQWMHLPNGQVTPAFIARVRGLLEGSVAAGSAPQGRPVDTSTTVPTSQSAMHGAATARPALRSLRFTVTTALLALGLVGAAYVAVDRLLLSRRGHVSSAVVVEKSIAVLPFADMSEKKDQEYFADGMAEETLDLLAKIPSIKVIGRTSSFQFKGHNEDLRTIGAKLGVTYVLEGSVRKSGDQVRVTAQLIDARDGAHVWSDSYDRSAGDVLRLQEEIAVAIVRALQITVGAAELSTRRSLTNVDAYDLYLHGHYAMERFDKDGFEQAVNYFRQALDQDPAFADAAVALSVTYEMQANWGFVPPADGYEQGRRAAESALRLNPAQALAHAVLGMIHTKYDWDWAAADRELQAALKLRPHDPLVLGAAGDLQLALGHYADASRIFKEAVARDPLYAPNYDLLSWAQIRLGQVAEAQASERRALEIQPGYVWGSTYLAMWLLVGGEREAALAAAQREDPGVRSGALALAYWALGRKAEADAALKRFIVEQADSNPYGIAWFYAFRGDKDEAFRWLEHAYAFKDPCLYAIKGEPLLASLEADPRYKAFLRKMKLPD